MYTVTNKSEKKATKDKPVQAMSFSLVEGNTTTSDNNTGIPAQMKDSIEQRSGLSFGDVRVHYNSPKPAQLNAHAYTQGNDIHIASGQERHLGHELGHVVQQKQGRVKPTMQMLGVDINDDAGLEAEADDWGSGALQMMPIGDSLEDDDLLEEELLEEDELF